MRLESSCCILFGRFNDQATLQQDIYLDLKAIPVYRRLLPQMQRHRVIQACFVKLTDMSNLLNLVTQHWA
jgi:hypothetical protein